MPTTRNTKLLAIPKTYECLGFTIKVQYKEIDGLCGHFDPQEGVMTLNPASKEELLRQTFWHEAMHSFLITLGYEELNSNEQFVDQIGQCLYQLEKTRKG